MKTVVVNVRISFTRYSKWSVVVRMPIARN